MAERIGSRNRRFSLLERQSVSAAFLIYFLLLILASAGFDSSSGMDHGLPIFNQSKKERKNRLFQI